MQTFEENYYKIKHPKDVKEKELDEVNLLTMVGEFLNAAPTTPEKRPPTKKQTPIRKMRRMSKILLKSLSKRKKKMKKYRRVPEVSIKSVHFNSIEPYCLEVINENTCVLGCTKGLYIASFQEDGSMELNEIIPEGIFWDVCYFPSNKLIYAFCCSEGVIYTINSNYEYCERQFKVHAVGDSRGRQLRHDKKKELLFVISGPNQVTCIDVDQDYRRTQQYLIENKPTLNMRAFRISFYKMCESILDSNRQNKASLSLSKSTMSNALLKIALSSPRGKQNKSSSRSSRRRRRGTFQPRLTLKDSLDFSYIETTERQRHQKVNLTRLFENYGLIPTDQPEKFTVDDVPGDFIRDFLVVADKEMIVFGSSNGMISMYFYQRDNIFCFFSMQVKVNGMIYRIASCPQGKFFGVTTTLNHLNLMEIHLLELDAKLQLREKVVVDYSSLMAASTPYSCLSFMNLDYNFDRYQLLIAGQECADNKLLVYAFDGQRLIKVFNLTVFDTFVNQAKTFDGKIWAVEQNGGLKIIGVRGQGPSTSESLSRDF